MKPQLFFKKPSLVFWFIRASKSIVFNDKIVNDSLMEIIVNFLCVPNKMAMTVIIHDISLYMYLILILPFYTRSLNMGLKDIKHHVIHIPWGKEFSSFVAR